MEATHTVTITNSSVMVDNRRLMTTQTGTAMLTELYRDHVNDYPKFFKMDLLCRLGFIATELLLQAEGATRFMERADRAVVLFNHTASTQADQAYEQTIHHREQFFPSPSAFVYTLPNIVTGEIAIRNNYHGETNFFILPTHDTEQMRRMLRTVTADPLTRSVVTGWIEAPDEQHIYAELQLIQLYGT